MPVAAAALHALAIWMAASSEATHERAPASFPARSFMAGRAGCTITNCEGAKMATDVQPVVDWNLCLSTWRVDNSTACLSFEKASLQMLDTLYYCCGKRS